MYAYTVTGLLPSREVDATLWMKLLARSVEVHQTLQVGLITRRAAGQEGQCASLGRPRRSDAYL